jgi:glyoxylase-like metal-dependent hydrolase (beta-lactamase superfamily II)
MSRHTHTLALCAGVAAGAAPLAAQDPLVMRIQPVAPQVFVISGFTNGNIVAVVGKSGVLLVDGQSARRVALADSALRTVTPLPVRILINTHYHDDHIEGNPYWRARGARIVAHEALASEARKDTTVAELDWHRTPAALEALPDQTFADSLTLDFEGEPVVLLHPPAAHTRTDAMVWFPRRNLIHTGDVLEREAPPFVDFWAGGTLGGMIGAIDRVLALADDRTVIVPGHGTITNRAGLPPYRAMLVAARDRIGARVTAGETVEAIVAARPLAEFEDSLGGPRRTAEFVRRVVLGMRGTRGR